MKTSHLNEDELQAYALTPNQTMPGFKSHIQGCESCAGYVATYRAMFDALKMQQRPAFEFDLADAVLKQLSEKNAGRMTNGLLLYSYALAAFGILGLLSFLFMQRILYWFVGTSATGLQIIIGTAVAIGWFQLSVLYRKHQRQIAELNFYSY